METTIGISLRDKKHPYQKFGGLGSNAAYSLKDVQTQLPAVLAYAENLHIRGYRTTRKAMHSSHDSFTVSAGRKDAESFRRCPAGLTGISFKLLSFYSLHADFDGLACVGSWR